jgi:hypothetical protein
MAMFGNDKNNSEEIRKIRERISPAEESIKKHGRQLEKQQKRLENFSDKVKLPSESQAEAATSARSARAHNSNVKTIKEEVISHREVSQAASAEISELKNKILADEAKIENELSVLQQKVQLVAEKSEKVSQLEHTIESSLANLQSILDSNETLNDEVQVARVSLSDISEIESKSNSSLKVVVSAHKEILNLKREIFGYNTENEEGETETVDGLKDELEQSYKDIRKEISDVSSELNNIRSNAEDNVSNFITSNEKRYETLYSKIQKLLPAAMTAGLSSAYDKKVVAEQKTLDNFEKSFRHAIMGLVAVSIIPFIVDLWLLLGNGSELIQVIQDTPQLIISILPLYFPVFWMAYSSSKKMNLSKRLIEEYTHKGVLSKTYEGLSHQVNEMDGNDESRELKSKLLFNLLQVNSENPGKLISNYDTSDHPVVDVLEKSMKLNESIEIASRIPGLGALAIKLDKKKKSMQAKNEKKVKNGMNSEILPSEENELV